MIPVTKPFLPPLGEYHKYLEEIWERNWLTNDGPLVNTLELKLKECLGVNHLLFLSNGTIALQFAIRALRLEGEIITTPFSFVATTSSIVWERCTPVFVDIDPHTLNIDPTKIQAAISEKTSAILATHVYGNPCNIEAIQEVASKHGIKVIFDAAHAFGVIYNGHSIFQYGDISICSLHATKLYHSIEGGLVVTKSPELLKKMAFMRNFGFNGPENFSELGINGKNSEFHAAMGLANLHHVKRIIERRQVHSARYDKMFRNLKAIKPLWNSASNCNYAYYPLIFQSEGLLLRCLEILNLNNIFPRRYFYPSLASSLPYVNHVSMKIADDIAKRVVCLPLYYDLTEEEINLICRLILRVNDNPK